MTNETELAAQAVKAIKETAIDFIQKGASGMQVAKTIANKFGFTTARFIMCDIALDKGMKKEVQTYLASFN